MSESHANVHCEKCGMEGISKCPHCRSVFPAPPRDDLERWGLVEALEWRVLVDKPDRLAFKVCDDEDHEKMLMMLWKHLPKLEERHIKAVTCRHRWVFNEGCSSEIDCGH